MTLKNLLPGLIFATAFSINSCSCASDTNVFDAAMAYHFDEPASMWEETFPLGNGRIGLMPEIGRASCRERV